MDASVRHTHSPQSLIYSISQAPESYMLNFTVVYSTVWSGLLLRRYCTWNEKHPLACLSVIYATTPDNKASYQPLSPAIVAFIRQHYCKSTGILPVKGITWPWVEDALLLVCVCVAVWVSVKACRHESAPRFLEMTLLTSVPMLQMSLLFLLWFSNQLVLRVYSTYRTKRMNLHHMNDDVYCEVKWVHVLKEKFIF